MSYKILLTKLHYWGWSYKYWMMIEKYFNRKRFCLGFFDLYFISRICLWIVFVLSRLCLCQGFVPIEVLFYIGSVNLFWSVEGMSCLGLSRIRPGSIQLYGGVMNLYCVGGRDPPPPRHQLPQQARNQVWHIINRLVSHLLCFLLCFFIIIIIILWFYL